MSHKIPMPSETELMSSYSEYGASISSLAKQFNTSNPTVRKWLKFHNIPRKSQKVASTEANNRKRVNPPSKESLINLYQNKSIKELEKIFSVSQATIYQWLNDYNIPLNDLSTACTNAKTRRRDKMSPSKDELERVYNFYKNQKVVAEYFGVSTSFLRTILKGYDIETHVSWRSQGEIDLFNFCENIDDDLQWISNDKSVINPYELDIVCPEKNLAIEYCGLYWHSEGYGGKEKRYHEKKRQACKDKNYDLITVFESDDMDKVKNLIMTKLHMNTKIGARECKILKIGPHEANDFHRGYHLHGTIGGSVHYGLFYDDQLVQVASFGKPRFDRIHDFECTRMTVKPGYAIMGGTSRLFKKIEGSIITYSDLRFGEGATYNHCGLKLRRYSEPNYWYFHKDKPHQIFSRVKFQKHKQKDILKIFDPGMTEYENMKMNGYDRIWDCGNAVYY